MSKSRIGRNPRPKRTTIQRVREALALIGIALGAILFLSLTSYHPDDPSWSVTGAGKPINVLGSMGATLSDICLKFFGYHSYVLVFLTVWFAFAMILQRKLRLSLSSFTGYAVFALLSAGLWDLWWGAMPGGYSSGGLWGQWLAAKLSTNTGEIGASLLLVLGILLAAVWTTQFSITMLLYRFWRKIEPWARVKSLHMYERWLDWRDGLARWRWERQQKQQHGWDQSEQWAVADGMPSELPQLELESSWLKREHRWGTDEVSDLSGHKEDYLPELTPPEVPAVGHDEPNACEVNEIAADKLPKEASFWAGEVADEHQLHSMDLPQHAASTRNIRSNPEPGKPVASFALHKQPNVPASPTIAEDDLSQWGDSLSMNQWELTVAEVSVEELLANQGTPTANIKPEETTAEDESTTIVQPTETFFPETAGPLPAASASIQQIQAIAPEVIPVQTEVVLEEAKKPKKRKSRKKKKREEAAQEAQMVVEQPSIPAAEVPSHAEVSVSQVVDEQELVAEEEALVIPEEALPVFPMSDSLHATPVPNLSSPTEKRVSIKKAKDEATADLAPHVEIQAVPSSSPSEKSVAKSEAKPVVEADEKPERSTPKIAVRADRQSIPAALVSKTAQDEQDAPVEKKRRIVSRSELPKKSLTPAMASRGVVAESTSPLEEAELPMLSHESLDMLSEPDAVERETFVASNPPPKEEPSPASKRVVEKLLNRAFSDQKEQALRTVPSEEPQQESKKELEQKPKQEPVAPSSDAFNAPRVSFSQWESPGVERNEPAQEHIAEPVVQEQEPDVVQEKPPEPARVEASKAPEPARVEASKAPEPTSVVAKAQDVAKVEEAPVFKAPDLPKNPGVASAIPDVAPVMQAASIPVPVAAEIEEDDFDLPSVDEMLNGMKPLSVPVDQPIPASVGGPVVRAKMEAKNPVQVERKMKPAWQIHGYEPPSLDILDYEPPPESDMIPEHLVENAKILEQTLENFGVRGQVKEILPGPVITIYEYLPDPGIKVSKVAGLADDLAMALHAMQVRVIAPIPGKGVVGIEIPNKTRETVYLKEILADEKFTDTEAKLPMAIGKNTTGGPYVANLVKMPHLLIAGTTGSGKSVGVNAMICSLLYNCSPEQVRLLMVDPKMLELSIYDGIPHLLLPVVTDPKKASVALNWVVSEMERRYRLMADAGVRNIANYNKLIEKRITVRDHYRAAEDAVDARRKVDINPEDFDWEDEDSEEFDLNDLMPNDPTKDYYESLPYIVVVIDELADLMMVAAKEVEFAIARLAQMARASGIHLLLATQRPSVDVLTGVIKANFPSRMAFQVKSKIDSRTILDQPGADRLLGSGDLLLMPPTSSSPIRLHGAYISEEEIHRIVKHLKTQGEPDYKNEILQDTSAQDDDDDEPADPMYDKAVDIVLRTRNASISFLQRKLRIGYNRSARIVEMMEREGLVSSQIGNRPREVLVPPPQD